MIAERGDLAAFILLRAHFSAKCREYYRVMSQRISLFPQYFPALSATVASVTLRTGDFRGGYDILRAESLLTREVRGDVRRHRSLVLHSSLRDRHRQHDDHQQCDHLGLHGANRQGRSDQTGTAREEAEMGRTASSARLFITTLLDAVAN